MVAGRGEVLGELRRGSDDFSEGLGGSFISSHLRGAPLALKIPETSLLQDIQIQDSGDNLDNCLSSVSKQNVHPIRAGTTSMRSINYCTPAPSQNLLNEQADEQMGTL